MTENNATNRQEIFVKMVLDAWHSKTNHLDKMLSELPDELLLKETAPGRNRGIYLLGHLTALADSIVPLLGHGKIAPHLFETFVKMPDGKTDALPTAAELRQEWKKVTSGLAEKMAATPTGEWFEKHTAISDADFASEPHRNKLNVVLSRVGHMDYHIGQLTFLKPANP